MRVFTVLESWFDFATTSSFPSQLTYRESQKMYTKLIKREWKFV